MTTNKNSTALRTHLCGDLRVENIGQKVTLCGWIGRRREHGEHLAFLDLRDFSGIVQCVVDNSVDVRSEWVIRVTGTVQARPSGTINENIPTGKVELSDCAIEILNNAEPPPFPIDQRGDDVDENVRLKFRYLDIRRERMQKNLRLRSAVNSAIRKSMESQGFTEIETPLLMPSTPEGAREFLVPSRNEPGSFYALPQSPQLWKQLLMVAGIDRYYQIAKCLRDEDLRADRQYEFMQLDAEMSFVDKDDVMAMISTAVVAAAKAATGSEPPPIERMTWHEAMNNYGIDKPDLRFEMKLIELTSVFAKTEFKAFASAESIKAICVRGADYPEQADLVRLTNAQAGDLILIVADIWSTTCSVLGQLRNDLGRPPVHEGPYRYVWVVDFPMFVGINPTTKMPQPGHHPFCHPHHEDVDRLESDPLSVRALAYDLVLNGWELGSGSIRIHEPDLQRRVFRQLGISDEDADNRFGFFL
ncbi:MAG: aspartate--tRNA ligase, partial [Acidimicrobiia bacterium]|nr:aspartate--tRNA ligase [Acidimicrobiia bacterium]